MTVTVNFKEPSKKIKVEGLLVGHTCILASRLFMVISHCRKLVNLVELKSGQRYPVGYDTLVEPVDIEINVL